MNLKNSRLLNLAVKSNINKRTNAIIAFLIFIVVFLIYFITKPASLSFWDCGEYVACSSILGVPHPPGNPFYIILGKFITMLPIGLSDAQAVSLLSIIFSSFAILFAYLSIVKLVAIFENKPFYCYFAGIIGSLFIAFSTELWINAIEAEVYGGLSFFISLIIWLTLIWTEKSKDFDHQNILLLIIFLFFLGFGVHQTTLQIAPAILLIVILPLIKFDKSFITKLIIYSVIAFVLYLFFNQIKQEGQSLEIGKYVFVVFIIGLLVYYLRSYVETRVWILALLIIIIGISTHLILPIRASAHPFINEGDPSNWQRFLDYIFRKQYGPTSFFVRRGPILFQIDHHFLRYFSWQFFDAEVIGKFLHISKNFVHYIAQLVVMILGITGIYYQFKKSKRSFIYLASLFFMTSIAMILVMNLSIDEVRNRPYFFISAYILWSFWIGIGAMGIVRYFAKRIKALGVILLVILFLLPVVNMVSHYHKNDRSQELLSLEYGTNFLNGLDKNAIIFTNGDNDTFPLWFAQAVYDPNADEYLLEDDTLKFREITGLLISDKKEIQARTKRLLNQASMAKRNLKGIRKDISIANLSLLNTPWYIKQLRDYEGIEINLKDKQIESIRPMKLPNEAVFKVGKISINLKKGTELYIKDQMVLQIIKDNFGKRPIYFAVTVADRVGFDDYLQSEGMADRLLDTRGKYMIDPARLNHNIENVFDYSSIYNEDLYKDRNMRRLINNYGADFMRMSNVFYKNNDYENAIKYLKKALDFIESKDKYIPSLSNLYAEMGDYENAYNTIAPVVKNDPSNAQIVYLASDYLKNAGNIDKALTLLDTFITNNPKQKYFVEFYLDICEENKKYEQGLNLINKILKKTPDNKKYINYKLKFENFLNQQKNSKSS
ncbi:MAG: DUF2723 domain-containing protein [Candidatus Cloacimonetes bacterium]|nr:DUF2723 domain-containing protein [Candidatus Cloacimonadota bacterium]MBL7085632.1 DUF2723 domain-containing protein [Candidatus Cloacimonadota bacterium]